VVSLLVEALDLAHGVVEGDADDLVTAQRDHLPPLAFEHQLEGADADARSDIFSLGAVFYELLSGKKAFNADSMHTILYKVLEEDPEPVRTWVPGLPGPFVAFVERCLAKEPDHRFQHAGELRDALRKVREALASGQYVLTEEAEATSGDASPVDAGAPTVMAPGPAPGLREPRTTACRPRPTSASTRPRSRDRRAARDNGRAPREDARRETRRRPRRWRNAPASATAASARRAGPATSRTGTGRHLRWPAVSAGGPRRDRIAATRRPRP